MPLLLRIVFHFGALGTLGWKGCELLSLLYPRVAALHLEKEFWCVFIMLFAIIVLNMTTSKSGDN